MGAGAKIAIVALGALVIGGAAFLWSMPATQDAKWMKSLTDQCTSTPAGATASTTIARYGYGGAVVGGVVIAGVAAAVFLLSEMLLKKYGSSPASASA